MHLSSEQSARFYRILAALTFFANDTYGVVSPARLADPVPDNDARARVHERMWADPLLIDDYVAENPDGLPPRDLAELSRWKDRVSGPALLLGYDDRGRALFAVGDRRVAVEGITQDLIEVVPAEPPTILLMTLLPFEDVVVYDSLVQTYGLSLGPGMRKMVEDEVTVSESWPLVEGASDFVRLAREESERALQADWDRLQRQTDRERWDREGTEPLPRGTHRGVLAGLSEDEREQEIDRWYRESGIPSDASDIAKTLGTLASTTAPSSTLEGTLMADTKDVLAKDARTLGLTSVSKLRKAELAQRVARAWLEAPEALPSVLEGCGDLQFQTFEELLAAPDGRIDFAEKDAAQHGRIDPCPPVTRLFLHEGTFTALIPDELRARAATLDLDAIRTRRQRARRVERLAEALTELCGAVSFSDLLARYEEVYGEKIVRDDMADAVFNAVVSGGADAPFDVWVDPDHRANASNLDDSERYVVHYSLGEGDVASAAQDAIMDEIERLDRGGTPSEEQIDGLLSRARENVDKVREERDAYVRDLLAAHEEKRRHGLCPLERETVERGVIFWKFRLPAVAALRDWLDAHVPDGEVDQTYAELTIEDLLDAQLGGDRPNDVLDAARDLGLFETTDDLEGLTGRLMAFSNALPSWWNNGWSPAELHDKMTGRRTFYNPDGTPMKVGRNDPCPCGSGKKYKRCCGR